MTAASFLLGKITYRTGSISSLLSFIRRTQAVYKTTVIHVKTVIHRTERHTSGTINHALSECKNTRLARPPKGLTAVLCLGGAAVPQRFGVGLVIERSLVRLPVGALSSQLAQLSFPSLRGR